MPRDSARRSQLSLFVSDPAASPEALARYEAIRLVLTSQWLLRQQSQQTGINYWRLWRDLRRFRRHGLLDLIDRRTLHHPQGRPAVETPSEVPVESVQETTIHGLTGEIVEENEGLLPQIPQMKTLDSFYI